MLRCNKDKNNPVSKFEQSVTKLSSCLPKCCANYFLFFLLGILFADQYRRTVTSWIQHSQLAHKFRNFFHHLPQIGHNNDNLLHQFLSELLNSYQHLFDGLIGIRFVVDDTDHRTSHQNKCKYLKLQFIILAKRIKGTSTIKAEPQKNIRKIKGFHNGCMKNATMRDPKIKKTDHSRNFQQIQMKILTG
ncbi:MAG: hypothetical protein LBE12_06405 [Planctomycetaceae bacterium]|jgi:hypothetical protein|nr:hypothetical protein [Planctomycetaceae bacterium]